MTGLAWKTRASIAEIARRLSRWQRWFGESSKGSPYLERRDKRSFGALGQLRIGSARPHRVWRDRALFAADLRIVFHPSLDCRELCDRAIGQQPAHADAAPLRISDLVTPDAISDVRAELRIGDARKLTRSRGLGAIQADAGHDHITHGAALLVPDRHDVHRLGHRIESGRLAVRQDHVDARIGRARRIALASGASAPG